MSAQFTRQSGLTLTEVLVVLVILGVLAAYLLPQIFQSVNSSDWRAQAEVTGQQMYQQMEDSKEKLGLLPCPTIGPGRAMFSPTVFAASDPGKDLFFGTTAGFLPEDPLGNTFTSSGAVGLLNYGDSGNCRTLIGQMTGKVRGTNIYVAGITRTWDYSFLGDCVDVVCVFNKQRTKFSYVALFRKTNRVVTASTYSPTFSGVAAAGNCCIRPRVCPSDGPC